MDPRTGNWIMSFVTLAAIGFAVYIYLSNNNIPIPAETPTPEASQVAVAPVSPSPLTTTSPSPKVTVSPTVTPSASPTTTTRTFTATQALTLPNGTESIPSGGSLSNIANEHGITSTELAKLNGITDVNLVYAGQQLIIPDDVAGDTYTLLFVTNSKRFDREKEKLASGGTSIYADPITAAQADTKNIYGLKADSPYSKQGDADATTLTLGTSDDQKVATVTVEKDPSGLWLVKKLVIKVVKASS